MSGTRPGAPRSSRKDFDLAPVKRKDFDLALVKELESYSPSPVNAIIFSNDGKYLLSGGDDKVVTVWNLDTFRCDQVLKNDEWGQVTALTLMYPDPQLGILGTDVPHLCVGSGRGGFTILPMDMTEKPFTEADSFTTTLSFNDPVEVQAYNASHSRLAIASHSGELKVYSLEQASLSLIWSSNFEGNTPAALFFYGTDCSLLTLALESAVICCRDLNTGVMSWKKSLRGGIVGAALADDNVTLLINNLSTGHFDLYRLPGSESLRSLPVLSTRHFTKQCCFLEGSRLALCGSDTNVMKVVDVSRNELVASLQTGKGEDMTQTVAASSKDSTRVLLAGASGGSIFIWEKVPVRNKLPVKASSVKVAAHRPAQTDSNLRVIVVFVLLATYANWGPPVLAFLKRGIEAFNDGMPLGGVRIGQL